MEDASQTKKRPLEVDSSLFIVESEDEDTVESLVKLYNEYAGDISPEEQKTFKIMIRERKYKLSDGSPIPGSITAHPIYQRMYNSREKAWRSEKITFANWAFLSVLYPNDENLCALSKVALELGVLPTPCPSEHTLDKTPTTEFRPETGNAVSKKRSGEALSQTVEKSRRVDQDDLQRLSDRVADLESRDVEKDRRLAGMENEIGLLNIFRGEMEDSFPDLHKLYETLHVLTSRIDVLGEAVEKAQTDIRTTEIEVANINKTAKEFEDAIEVLHCNVTSAKGELKEYASAIANLQERLESQWKKQEKNWKIQKDNFASRLENHRSDVTHSLRELGESIKKDREDDRSSRNEMAIVRQELSQETIDQRVARAMLANARAQVEVLKRIADGGS